MTLWLEQTKEKVCQEILIVVTVRVWSELVVYFETQNSR